MIAILWYTVSVYGGKKKKRISPIKKNQYIEKLGELLLVLVTMVTILYRWKDNSQRQSAKRSTIDLEFSL